MPRHFAIILTGLLSACATSPAQRGWPPSAGWQADSAPGKSSAARPKRSGTAAARPEPTAYRVVADGTVGCTDPKALRLLHELRESGKGGPRALAQAHREGQCMTVFQVSHWKLDRAEGDLVRLDLLDPGPHQPATTLYFMRNEVEPQS